MRPVLAAFLSALVLALCAVAAPMALPQGLHAGDFTASIDAPTIDGLAPSAPVDVSYSESNPDELDWDGNRSVGALAFDNLHAHRCLSERVGRSYIADHRASGRIATVPVRGPPAA
ncbi:MAG: hypothetical protein IPJ88_03320 [Myxococcales bacterium]|nr:MAG: hypothetical protein IPJ88_03320 [Myxococcales bacterium]